MSTYNWTDGELVNAEKLNAYGEGIDEAKETILAATTHQPKIENGTWWTWDSDTSAYVDTEVEATGEITVVAEYQVSDSGTVIPTTWQTSIPTVSKGQYLWTRNTYNDGTVSYSIAYNGQDGSGSGDMSKSTYDTDDNGIVDNAEKLEGHSASYFATAPTILTGSLAVGDTSLTLSDSAITEDSTVDIYTDTYGVNPTAVTVSSGSIVLTFDSQTVAVSVKVEVR